MIITLTHQKKKYCADLSNPIDISIPIRAGDQNPTCYGTNPVAMEPIIAGDFVGSVALGGVVNHQQLTISPHGNGTHTECYGHLSDDANATIQNCLTQFHYLAQVVSITPKKNEVGDAHITRAAIANATTDRNTPALIIRSQPNSIEKLNKDYSGTNPPYIETTALDYLCEIGITHLLVDLPSVDREVDGGQLAGHKAFWNFPSSPRKEATITELIYVPDTLPDGLYLLNLQIISLHMDASPSKPLLYKLKEVL